MKYTDRDISWLSFNERIIQEAEDESVHLHDRMKFLAIYSSNLEEFYKVRVASHRFAQKYKGDKKNKFGFKPSFILREISEEVEKQQARLGKVFKEVIIPSYEQNGVRLLSLDSMDAEHIKLAQKFYKDKLNDFDLLKEVTNEVDLELINQAVYLYILDGNKQWLLHLDYSKWGRFINLIDKPELKTVIQLDDIYKIGLKEVLGNEFEAYAIKVSRDAELYIDDEQEDDIVKKIQKSIKKRETGLPARLLFDERIRFKHINALRKKTNIPLTGLIPGGTYHNFYDFFGFPKSNLEGPVQSQTIGCSLLDKNHDWFQVIKNNEVFLSFPYQDYDYVTEYLKKACEDEFVTEISITLYRVASDSAICKALEKAALNGKKVFVLDEVQARFDEESNIFWGERLKKAGANVKYGVEGLKVHAKIFKFTRIENGYEEHFGYLGTGNFNEKTAGIYGDHALFTADPEILSDLDQVFSFLKGESNTIKTKELLVAPFTLRSSLVEKINREIKIAKGGGKGHFQIKLNALEDIDMIDAIRE
ncbi:MAG: phospholipase D-like domain-containing protein, partial [Flavobacteriales bacterium]